MKYTHDGCYQYVPVCIASGDFSTLITAEPAVVIPTEADEGFGDVGSFCGETGDPVQGRESNMGPFIRVMNRRSAVFRAPCRLSNTLFPSRRRGKLAGKTTRRLVEQSSVWLQAIEHKDRLCHLIKAMPRRDMLV
jgi:hypothetical protein